MVFASINFVSMQAVRLFLQAQAVINFVMQAAYAS